MIAGILRILFPKQAKYQQKTKGDDQFQIVIALQKQKEQNKDQKDISAVQFFQMNTFQQPAQPAGHALQRARPFRGWRRGYIISYVFYLLSCQSSAK